VSTYDADIDSDAEVVIIVMMMMMRRRSWRMERRRGG